MTDKLSAEELVAGLERIERTMREKWEDYGVDILAAARARIAEAERMREALEGLVAAVVRDSAEHGISGYTGARLSDARAALKEQT